MKNYYAILEVSRNADREEIKKSYLEHICFIRPDRFEKDSPDWTNATNLLIDINEAYLCLNDPEKRGEYDAMIESESLASRARAGTTTSTRLTFAFLVAAVVLLFFYFSNTRDNLAAENEDAITRGNPSSAVSRDEKNVPAPGGLPSQTPNPGTRASAAVLGIPRERPLNSATQSNSCQYVPLGSDEFYESLLEVDSSAIHNGNTIAAIWMKHIQNERQGKPHTLQSYEGSNVNMSNVGWFVTLHAYDLVNDSFSMLKIIYYDKFGSVLGEYSVPDDRVQTVKIAPGSASGDILKWIKIAAERTSNQTNQHKRALQFGRLISIERDNALNTAYFRAKGKIENFDVKKGGTITAEFCYCRELPVQSASVIRSKMIKGTPVFVTKRYRNEKGNVWFYIEHIQAKGWVPSRNLKVY